MREIKFRVFSKETNNMLCPGHGTLDAMPLWYLRTQEFADQYDLMQFTGLRDKHGKEIYEGDILRDANGNEAEVCMSRDLQWVGIYGVFEWPIIEMMELEIIGNINENPDLLQKWLQR